MKAGYVMGMLVVVWYALQISGAVTLPVVWGAEMWDQTIGDYRDVVAPSGDPTSPPPGLTSRKVLWDTSHGVDLGYQPSGYYSALVTDLASQSINVTTTALGVLVDDPAPYNAIVVCEASSHNSAYSSAEVARITSYVQNGGGLLILGDNTACTNGNIQPLASAFGVSLGRTNISPYDLYTTALAAHPIFTGVHQIYMRAAGEISAAAPSTLVAWQEGTGKGLVAAATYGDGRVVTLGDVNAFDNSYRSLADNVQFARSTFGYLVTPEPSALALLGVGAIGLIAFARRRRQQTA